jgi:hypothetical protein
MHPIVVVHFRYTILEVKKSETTVPSGVLDAVAFADCHIPENILPWVGASILGTLESLGTKSISRESYLKTPSGGPDYTVNCLVQVAPPPADSRPPPPEKWKVKVGRPSAWGCGSLAVPPEVKQHAV